MDFSEHSSKFPAEIREYFSSTWEKRALWQLQVPVSAVPVALLEWHLDYPFWSSAPPQPLFDLLPRSVLDDPDTHPVHWRRVQNADLAYPLAVARFGARIVILDGFHRLLLAILRRLDRIAIRPIPKSLIYDAT